jgi:crossover junction endodeoxyribonuclease RusA
MIRLGWPHKALWPNFRSRTHWPKTSATKNARAEAFYATRAAKVSVAAGDVPVIVQATFYPPDRRKRDYDNCGASIKAHLDGIADALGVNDNSFRPRTPIIGEPIKGGAVVVEIVTGEGV